MPVRKKWLSRKVWASEYSFGKGILQGSKSNHHGKFLKSFGRTYEKLEFTEFIIQRLFGLLVLISDKRKSMAELVNVYMDRG